MYIKLTEYIAQVIVEIYSSVVNQFQMIEREPSHWADAQSLEMMELASLSNTTTQHNNITIIICKITCDVGRYNISYIV